MGAPRGRQRRADGSDGAPRRSASGGKGPLGRTAKTDRRDAEQAAFLAAFSIHGNIQRAVDAVRTAEGRPPGEPDAEGHLVSRDIHYRWLREDEDYADRFQAARDDFADRLESEARRRAIDGVKRYVVSAGKLVYGEDGRPLIEHVYSDSLLSQMLKAHRRELYGDRATHEITGKDGGAVALDVVFDLDLGDGAEEDAPAT